MHSLRISAEIVPAPQHLDLALALQRVQAWESYWKLPKVILQRGVSCRVQQHPQQPPADVLNVPISIQTVLDGLKLTPWLIFEEFGNLSGAVL